MENTKNFLKLCNKNYSEKDSKLIQKAIEFIKNNLKEKNKFSGKSLVEFNIEIGEILAMSGLPIEIIASGILYGTEKIVPVKNLSKEFGEEIAGIVFGQLRLKNIRKNNINTQAELIRKILITGLDDIRIIFVKLAAKLANLRIISALNEKEQKRISQDILDIYVPLAMRLGLDYIKNNLEDLAFKIIYPKKYEEISNFFKDSKEERKKFIDNYIIELKKLLGPKVGLLEIKGRDKQIRSIYDKIIKTHTPLEKQKDHYAIRIIVKNESDCYDVLGILHKEYIPVEGRLKDYINSPKANGYQSIHTVLKIHNSNKEIEVQIRTEKMNEFAEEGAAAHWSYKKIQGDTLFEKKVGWMRALIESQKNSSNKEFMKNLKLDLFASKIHCYTPKGDVRELPKNATLLDFAYYIHQAVGEKAIGGRVDGKFVPLREVLTNGVVVEILTNKNQRPRRDWLKFVISSKAKSGIRKGLRKYESIPIPRKSAMSIKIKNDFDNLVESPEFPGAQFSFAKCCYPLPKDELIGVMKSNKKILVHKQDCSHISSNLKNAASVFWKDEFNQPLNLKALCEDRSGILADLLNTISRGGFVVRSANAKVVGNGKVECDFVVIPKRLDEVVKMIDRVKRVRSVLLVFFE